ncbi:MAG: DNA/RNA non-specific endonuclease, partial [Pedobacter sp.]
MKRSAFFFLFLAFHFISIGQSLEEKIKATSSEINALEAKRRDLNNTLENLKLEKISADLKDIGLPAVAANDELVRHSAYWLDYSPEFKQARWVAHIISPDVINGVVFRTNDFRVDSSIKAGSPVEADYFLKTMKADSTYVYDGFGYDRGHLAPSADFRWSSKALSESYFYSNMSPQLADFNRGCWGDLEDAIRGYIYRHPQSQLYVVTGPFLEAGLPKIERGVNKVTIPKRYFKVILDLQNKKGIGFIMPNEAITKPLHNFAVSIDEVEKQTGLNFFSKLPEDVQKATESQLEPITWLPTDNFADVEPLAQENLPRNHFNTSNAKASANRNEEITVCGTVVGTRISKAGNILINLDKQFPNQVFTVFIKKEDIVNFSNGFPHYTHLLAKYSAKIAIETNKAHIDRQCFNLAVDDAIDNAQEFIR